MRVFLAGAEGFLGRHIVVALRSAGHEVIATARGIAAKLQFSRLSQYEVPAIVGIIYLMTVLVLTVLLGIASRQHHVSSGSVDVYRFPPVLITVLRVGVAVPALLGLGVCHSFGRPLELYETAFLLFLLGSLTIVIAAQLWVVSHYTLELQVGSLTVIDWLGRRLTSIDDIRKVVISRPWRGRGYMDVFSATGMRLEHIDAGLQDFDEIADFVLNQSPPGTVVREKAPGEKWIQRTT